MVLNVTRFCVGGRVCVFEGGKRSMKTNKVSVVDC